MYVGYNDSRVAKIILDGVRLKDVVEDDQGNKSLKKAFRRVRNEAQLEANEGRTFD
jgi:Tfp pilus assembly protein PilP